MEEGIIIYETVPFFSSELEIFNNVLLFFHVSVIGFYIANDWPFYIVFIDL